MIDLSSYSAVESAMFIKWVVPTLATKYMSDYHTDVTIGGNIYTNEGRILDVSAMSSELKVSPSQLTITLDGLATNAVFDVLDKDIKGSEIEIYRGFFDATTHSLLSLTPAANPLLKFKGIVTNFLVSSDVSSTSQLETTEIVLTCNSIVEVLDKKVAGRRTNKQDFPDEQSMDRVQILVNSNFNFGAPE